MDHRTIDVVALTALSVSIQTSVFPDEGEIRLRFQNGEAQVQVIGDGSDDWWIQGSDDLETWSNVPETSALLSGADGAIWASIGGGNGPKRFFRAVRTAGLFDTNLLRMVTLTFSNPDWMALLADMGEPPVKTSPAIWRWRMGLSSRGLGRATRALHRT